MKQGRLQGRLKQGRLQGRLSNPSLFPRQLPRRNESGWRTLLLSDAHVPVQSGRLIGASRNFGLATSTACRITANKQLITANKPLITANKQLINNIYITAAMRQRTNSNKQHITATVTGAPGVCGRGCAGGRSGQGEPYPANTVCCELCRACAAARVRVCRGGVLSVRRSLVWIKVTYQESSDDKV